MSRRLQMPCAALAGTLLSSFLVSPVLGDVSPEDLRLLREQIEQMRIENAQMRSEMDRMQASQRDEWFSEKRAEELRMIVRDVLDDADGRASFQNGMTAGWDRNFFIGSADGNFRLRVAGLLQTRYLHNYKNGPFNDHWRGGFEVTRARVAFSGNVISPDIEYMLRGDIVRNEPGSPPPNVQVAPVGGLFYLRDAWIRYRLNEDWSVRVGQFKLGYNREELVSSAHQLAVERSVINQNMNLGRSPGIELAWQRDTTSLTFGFSNGAVDSFQAQGASLGGGLNPTNKKALQKNTEYAFTARWEELLAGRWQQFEDMTAPPGEDFGMLFGLGAHFQETEYDRQFSAVANENTRLSITSDLSLEWSGANLFLSGFYNYLDGITGVNKVYGAVVQGGWYIAPKVELFARYEFGYFDKAGDAFIPFESKSMHLVTAGVNWYLNGHDVKFTTDLGVNLNRAGANWMGLTSQGGLFDYGPPVDITGWRHMRPGENTQVVLRAQLQLMF